MVPLINLKEGIWEEVDMGESQGCKQKPGSHLLEVKPKGIGRECTQLHGETETRQGEIYLQSREHGQRMDGKKITKEPMKTPWEPSQEHTKVLMMKPGIMVHACYSSTGEMEARGLQV